MQKSSEFSSPVLDVIRQRRSRRAYAPRNVEQEKIHSLFEAARWAPSSLNEQPWFYVYATQEQPALWQKIFASLKEGNRIWAHRAPLLIVSLVRTRFIRLDSENPAARYDLGAANAFLSLQAAHLGLNVHQMGGFDHNAISRDLHVPDDLEPVIIMAIGYPGDMEELPEKLRLREKAPRERYLKQEFVRNAPFDPPAD